MFYLSRLEGRWNAHSLSSFTRYWTFWLFFLSDPSHVQNRGHNNILIFIPIQPRIDVYKFSFYPRVLLLWNNLSPNIVNAKTYEEFQDHVHKLAI